jgi:hypothetical protein
LGRGACGGTCHDGLNPALDSTNPADDRQTLFTVVDDANCSAQLPRGYLAQSAASVYGHHHLSRAAMACSAAAAVRQELGITWYAINLSADFRSSFCLCRRTYRTTHSSLTAVMKNPRILCYVPEFDIFYTVFLNPASFVPRFEIKILFLFLYQFRLQRTLSLTSLFEKRRHSHGFLGGQNHSVNSRY